MGCIKSYVAGWSLADRCLLKGPTECPLKPKWASTVGATTETGDKPIRGPYFLPTFEPFGAHLALLAKIIHMHYYWLY